MRTPCKAETRTGPPQDPASDHPTFSLVCLFDSFTPSVWNDRPHRGFDLGFDNHDYHKPGAFALRGPKAHLTTPTHLGSEESTTTQQTLLRCSESGALRYLYSCLIHKLSDAVCGLAGIIRSKQVYTALDLQRSMPSGVLGCCSKLPPVE